jgi:branched-subunit amino acid aminotransferase/4-amino-4-deoxychorismate lyase
VILANERGELCEGTITSLFLDDGSGILKTPPLACGLLAGVLRKSCWKAARPSSRSCGRRTLPLAWFSSAILCAD